MTNSDFERELEKKYNQLIKMSLIVGIILLLVIASVLYLFYKSESEKNKNYLNASEVGYYLRCDGDSKNCGILGECHNVSLYSPGVIDYQDSICLE